MTDSDVLELVRDSLGDLRMERPIDQITTRGRTLRRRRQGVVGAAALAALGVGATLAAALPPAAAGQAVDVDLAAWTGGEDLPIAGLAGRLGGLAKPFEWPLPRARNKIAR